MFHQPLLRFEGFFSVNICRSVAYHTWYHAKSLFSSLLTNDSVNVYVRKISLNCADKANDFISIIYRNLCVIFVVRPKSVVFKKVKRRPCLEVLRMQKMENRKDWKLWMRCNKDEMCNSLSITKRYAALIL